jgi:hypothetical protein
VLQEESGVIAGILEGFALGAAYLKAIDMDATEMAITTSGRAVGAFWFGFDWADMDLMAAAFKFRGLVFNFHTWRVICNAINE